MTAALLPRVRALLNDRRAGDLSDADLLRMFVSDRDENAFATLVRRHGPLVLGTARRVVGNAADAEDVFQATFLLLARQASTIRNPAALAGWLHGVASRMARTARRAAARRRHHEARVSQPRPTSHCDLSWREVQALFEEELARLPDRWRIPFVLCTLNGEPRADVARRLGIKEGTISSRLADAKKQLQQRLSTRGVSLAAVVGALALPELAISGDLVSRTILSVGTGPVPAAVSALIRGGVVSGKKLIAIAVMVIPAAVLAFGPGRSGDAANGKPMPPAANEVPAKILPAKGPAKAEAISVRGKLLDADGKPLANVPVRLWSFQTGDKMPDPVTTTAADGSFHFEADPKAAVEEARVVLIPPGRPAQWLPLSRFTSEQTLKVPADDVPFKGRVATLENQPLPGVTVEVVRVANVGDGRLTAWLDKNVAMRKQSYWLNEDGLVTVPGSFVLGKSKTTTDGNGKFSLTGFGRDRVLTVKVYGPKVETKFFWVVTRSDTPKEGYIRTPDFNHGVYGPDVTVMLAPSRPLVGTVRDAKTGKPVAGAIVSEVNTHIPRAVTDTDGRYRLEGVPKKSHYGLNVCGQKGRPYFDSTHMWVADVAGLDPLETNLTVHRGLELTGRVVDKRGRPVRAEVMYDPLDSNPNAAKSVEPRVISSDGWRTKPDGTFYVTVWPGKGVIAVTAGDGSRFATVDVDKILGKLGVRSRPVGPVQALVPLDIDEAKPESLTLTITLEDGVSRKGTVVGPDGKPVAEVIAAGLRDGPLAPMKSSGFTVSGVGASSRRLLLFMDAEKKHGALQAIAGAGTDPLRVTLQPLGSATGEVRKDGTEAWEGLTVTAVPFLPRGEMYDNVPDEVLKNQGVYGMMRAPWWKLTKRIAKTDSKGRFHLEGLVPGLEYTIYVSDGDLGEPDTLVTSKRNVTVKSGKTTDLGMLMKVKR